MAARRSPVSRVSALPPQRTGLRPVHGGSLALVLMVGAVVFVAVFALAAIAVQQVNLSHAFESDRAAQGLAEGLVAQAMAQLRANPTYGRYETETLQTAPDPQDPSRYATLTFDPTSGGPYCTNNWDGNSPVGYGNAEIPPGSTHLWIVGHAGSMVRGIEVMVSVPQSPFVLQTEGVLQFSNGLTADGAPDLASALAIAAGSPNLTPSSIAGEQSISGVDACTITGNVDSPGTTDLPQGSTVDGTLRTDPVDVPQMNPSQYDPSGQSGAVLLNTSHLSHPPPITQLSYTPAGLTVTGDLQMANGLLYVPGDLVVTGAIYGHGLVAATGSVTVRGSTSLSGSVQETALLGGGDVSTAGNFVGLLYAGEQFKATNGTLIGSFIGSGGLSTSNVLAIYVPDAAQFLLRSLPQSPGQPDWVQQGSLLGGNTGYTLQFGSNPSPDALSMLALLQQQLNGQPYSLGNLPLMATSTTTVSDPRLYHPLPPSQLQAVDLSVATSILRIPGQHLQRILVQAVPAFTWNGSSWQPAAGSGWTQNSSGLWTTPNVTISVNGQPVASTARLDQQLQNYNHTTLEQMMNAIYQAQQKLSQTLNASPMASSTPYQYNMSLNQFVSNPSPLSITSWRDH